MRNEKYKNWEEGWAVVKVEDDVIAGWVASDGGHFVQIDVPEERDEEIGRQPTFTRFIPVYAIRSITPCSVWGVYQILGEKYDDTLCDAFHFNAYTQHASEPDGTIPEPINQDDIPF